MPRIGNSSRTARLHSAWVFAGLILLQGSMVQEAYAWNESGHRAIAAAAADQMSPELRAHVVTALKAHPRYKEDLAAFRPRRLKGLSEAQWLMGQAASWPDHARSFDNASRHIREGLVERYHRGNWHYINLPAYLVESDQKLRIKDPTRVSSKRRSKKPADVLTALNFIKTELESAESSMAEKGLWISWALHLIADVHQPLHTTAMFSKDRWPRGDRGGNEVKIAGSGNNGRLDSLHYFWDKAISNRRAPREIEALVTVLAKQQTVEVADNEVDPVMWIHEGREIAEQVVYGPLRSQLIESPVVTIPHGYTQDVHAAALKRGALAARRTALWLAAALQSEELGAAQE